jgi:NDP-sugar pyrophosphorylase family protein
VPATTGVSGLVGSFSEKPQTLLTDLANMAIALFEPSFLQYLEPTDSSLFGQSLLRAMDNGIKFGYFTHGKWRHIQTLTDWLAARRAYPNP